MRKMARISFFIGVVTLLLFTASAAFASTTYTEGYLMYQIENGGVVITGYTGEEKKVTVPSLIAGYPVSEIASGAFANASTVKKIELPDTVMVIEAGAFASNQTIKSESDEVKKAADDAEKEEPSNPKSEKDSEKDQKDDSKGPQTTGTTKPTNGGAEERVVDDNELNPKGIYSKDGSLYTVDDLNRLVKITPNGKTKVIDSEHEYSIKDNGDGTYSIVRSDGKSISINVIEGLEKEQKQHRTVLIVSLAAIIIGLATVVLSIIRRKRINGN